MKVRKKIELFMSNCNLVWMEMAEKKVKSHQLPNSWKVTSFLFALRLKSEGKTRNPSQHIWHICDTKIEFGNKVFERNKGSCYVKKKMYLTKEEERDLYIN